LPSARGQLPREPLKCARPSVTSPELNVGCIAAGEPVRLVIAVGDSGRAGLGIDSKSEEFVLRAGPHRTRRFGKRRAIVHLQTLSRSPALDAPVRPNSIKTCERRRPDISSRILENLGDFNRACWAWFETEDAFPRFCSSGPATPKASLGATP